MEELDDFVERLMADVEVRCGCRVYKKFFEKSKQYHLRKHESLRGGVFAYIRRVIDGRVVPNRCFPIEVKEKYTIKAGVAHLANRRNDNGCHNEPARYWWVLEGDHQSYNRAVEALSKICQVR